MKPVEGWSCDRLPGELPRAHRAICHGVSRPELWPGLEAVIVQDRMEKDVGPKGNCPPWAPSGLLPGTNFIPGKQIPPWAQCCRLAGEGYSVRGPTQCKAHPARLGTLTRAWGWRLVTTGSARAVMTEKHRLGDLNNRNV